MRTLQTSTTVRCNTYTDCFNCSATLGNCYWDSKQRACINGYLKDRSSLYTVLPTDNGYIDDWSRFYTNCTDELGLCKTNLPFLNSSVTTVPQLSKAEKIFFDTNITYTMEISGSYIPPNYSCQWKIMTSFNNDYEYKILYTPNPK